MASTESATEPSESLRALQAALPECVQTAQAERYRASLDNLRLSHLPEAVVIPRDEEDVATVLKLANRMRVPVTARGAGSSTTGSATPIKGGWVLDFAGWKNLHIDRAARMAYVQPGVTVEELDAAARAEGLFYPPDPGSKKHATIGGTLACNAGGLRGAKYGVTRDYVYALEGFLPTGEFVKWGGDVKKYVSGYNMRDLWIGSEGTLGLITGAVLKLLPAPGAVATFLASFPDDAAALKVVRTMLEEGHNPSILELIDRQTSECFQIWAQRPDRPEHLFKHPVISRFISQPGAYLLIELDGHPAEVEEGKTRLEALLRDETPSWYRADSAQEAAALWQVRRASSQSMFRLGDTKLNEDVVVPLRSYEALFAYTLELRDRIGLGTPTFGHAADGNFHVHIMYNRGDAEQALRAEKGIHELMAKVVELGGVITGEHGVGLAKSPFLELQHSPAEIRAMRAIKKALDPYDIMNPGKMWEPFKVWEHPREEVDLPWDHK
ncbi:MAG: FAD-linked oxidase C-terminal domain-containing protein [Verrucomicrobiota bacterium JB022]|nr:FAD-linked oxidase C-terminal domain-containing protein [Verrucomicrobiota bacterium JB022]